MSAWARLVAGLLSVVLLAACGGSGSGGGNPPAGLFLQEIRVSPTSADLPVGLSLQYVATGVYSDGSESDLTGSVSWASSSPTNASIDGNGLATALLEGSTEISAGEDGVEGSVQLTVSPATATSVSVFPVSVSAPLGTSGQLRMLANFSDSSQQDVTAAAEWATADSEIAVIVASGEEAGYTTLVGVGASSVAATYEDLSDSTPLTVSSAELVDIKLHPVDAGVGAGTPVQYTAIGIYSDGSKSDLTDEVSWSSEQVQVASIDAQGLADAQAQGGTAIRASWQPPVGVSAVLSSFSVSTPLTVTGATVEAIVIVPDRVSAAAGTQAQLTLFAYYSDGTSTDVTEAASWLSADNNVATVVATGEGAGLVSLEQQGATSVAASFAGFSDSAPVAVSAANLRSVVVTPAEDSVPAGLSRQFTATAWYTDDSSVDVTRQAGWSSSSREVAEVDDAGLATGISSGTTSIKAQFESLSDAASLTVTTAVIGGVEIIPGLVSAPLGTAGQLRLFADYSDGSRQEVTADATWTSADPAIAVVVTSGDDAGQGQLVGVGSTTISANYQGFPDSIPVVVSNAELTELQVTPADAINPVGVPVSYTATGLYSDGSTRDLTNSSSWSSSNTVVAAVGNDGVANTYAAGASTITAIYAGITATTRASQSGASDSEQLTVSAAEIASVAILPGPVSGPAGTQAQRFLQATYTDGTSGNVSTQAGWEIIDTTIASVIPTGVQAGRVSLLAEGQTQLRAVINGFSDAVNVNVTTALLESLVLTPAASTVPDGVTVQYTATAIYGDGSNIDVTDQAVWRSNVPDIVTVDDQGLASTHGTGLAAITATFQAESATGSLFVSDAAVTDLQIIPGKLVAPLGTTHQLRLLATFSDGMQTPVTRSALWVAAIPSIVQIVPTGEFAGHTTLVGQGATQVSASYGGASTSITVDVSAAVLTDIVIDPLDASVAAGLAQQYTATGLYSDNSSADLTDQVAWKSSSTSVATIEPGGLAHALVTGDTTISAAYRGVTAGLRQVLMPQSVATGLTVTAALLESLQITPGAVLGPRGTSNQLLLTAFYSDGSTADVTAQASWTSTDANIATVTTGDAEAGFIRLLNAGGARIEAKLEGIDTSIPVVVTPAQLVRLEVQPQAASIAAGLKFKYTAWGYYTDDAVVDLSTEASWLSSDQTVASVNGDGRARGIAAGTSTITASVDSFSDAAQITVTAANLTDLQIEPGSLSMPLGSNEQLTLTAFYSDGSSQDVTTSATWTSGNTAIAAVVTTGDSAGAVTGKGEGSTSISAAFGAENTSVPVTVTAAQLQSITVSPADTSAPLGQTLQYSAQGDYSDGTVRDITNSVSWRSTDTGIVSIDQTGRAQTHAVGTATISATQSAISDSGLLQVTNATPQQLLVTPASVAGPVGTTTALEATAVFSDGTREDVTQDTIWESSAPAIAEVVPSGAAAGQLSLRGVGSAEVSARYATLAAVLVPVEVSAASLLSIGIEPLQESVPLGVDVQYTATGTYSDGSTEDISSEVTWQSSDIGVATVSSQGLADTLTAGSTTITASLGGVSSQASLLVTTQAAVRLQIIPPFITGPDGTRGPLLALAQFTDGSLENVSDQAAWSTADEGIVTVDLVTGARFAQYTLQAPGSSEITANFDGLTSLIPVTVEAAVLVSIEVSPASVSTAVGLEAEFTATGFYSNGDTATLTDEVIWTSSDISVSQFTAVDGVAVAVGVGTAEIVANLAGVEGTAEHIVTAATAVELIITPPLWSDPAGTSRPFTARAIYTDDSDADVTQEASWSSTDETVATVGNTDDQDGIVNLLVAGQATITAALGSLADAAPVFVTNPVVTDILVEPHGETYPERFLTAFTATAIYSNGETSDVTDEAGWRSDDNAVAITGQRGAVYTIAPGEAGIEAIFGGQTGTAPITVVTASVIDLQVEPGFIDDPKGTSIQLKATAFYDNNQSEDVTRATTWVSADESKATVVAEGEDAGLTELTGVGATTITASYQGVTRSIDVTVSAALLVDIIVEPADATIALGLSQQYQATGVYSDGSFMGLEEGLVWTSSAESVASIDPGGLAQTIAAGATVISASLDGITGSTGLTVSEATVLELNIDPAVDSQAAGVLTPLTVTAVLTDGSTVDVTRITQWQVQVGGGATVIPVLGLLSHNTEGLTLIQASLPELASSSNEQAVLLATTSAATLQRIELTPDPLAVEMGVPASYLATGYYSDNTSSILNAEADWTVADSSIATVSELGEVNGVAPGATTVTAAVGDISDTADLAVEDTVLESIQITPADIVAPAGTNRQMTATGFYTNGENEDLTELVLWESDDDTVARVATGPGDGGDLYLVAVGDATVTAVLDGIVSNDALVSVTAAELLAIDVIPADVDVPKGATQQFSALGIYTDGEHPLDKDSGLLWSSSPSFAATINENGLATAVGFLFTTATITARVEGVEGVSGTATLHVTDAVIDSLAITPAGLREPAGTSVGLTATAHYTDGSESDVTREANWESSDTTVATVVASGPNAGLVDMLTPGVTDISVYYDGWQSVSTVEVTDAILVDILVAPPLEEVPVGFEVDYTATGVFSDGSTAPINGDVTWQSSAVTVATISPEGVADAIAVGTTTISAALDAIEGDATLTVNTAIVTSIEVSAEKSELFENEIQRYTATALLSDGSTEDVSNDVVWTVEPATIAEISNFFLLKGLLQAKLAGTGLVRATLSDESALSGASLSVTGTTDLTVLSLELVAIEIDDAGETLLFPGQTAQWSAEGLLSNGDYTDVTETATWFSSDSTVVTVEVIDGSAVLTAVANVTATVQITAVVDLIEDSNPVQVVPLEIVDITIYPVDPRDLAVGSTQDFTAIARLNDSPPSHINVTDDVDWLAVDTDPAATVAQFEEAHKGRALGVAEGVASIQVTTSDGDTFTGPDLTVVAIQPDALIVVPDFLEMPEDSEWPFVAMAHYTDGSYVDVTDLVQWTTSDDSVVKISDKKDEWGLAEAKEEQAGGATPITITADWVDEGEAATASVTVIANCAANNDFEDRPILIEVYPSPEVILHPGETRQMIAIGTFVNKSDPGITCQQSTTTQDGHWHTSDENIADIEHNKKGAGRVTGIDLGTAVIDNEWKKETGETDAVVIEDTPGSQSVEVCEAAWQTGVVTYLPGDEVSYDGNNYQCVQKHTPQGDPGWAPPNTPALWAPISPCL